MGDSNAGTIAENLVKCVAEPVCFGWVEEEPNEVRMSKLAAHRTSRFEYIESRDTLFDLFDSRRIGQ